MKKILLMLVLFTVYAQAQISVIGDTTELKTTQGSGVVLLLQYYHDANVGGGLFKKIDSTYTENGTIAFDHPYQGSQWARMNLVDQYVRPSTADNEILAWSTDHYAPVTSISTGAITGAAISVTTITAVGTTLIKTGTGGSATDSSVVINGSSGSPRVNLYGTDGDTYSIGVNTSDAALFAGASGGYSFDQPLLLPATVIGEDVFETTAETDTVTISGALTTDTYIISGQYTAGVDQQDILQWEAISGKLVVHRMAAGESALKYSWLRIPTP